MTVRALRWVILAGCVAGLGSLVPAEGPPPLRGPTTTTARPGGTIILEKCQIRVVDRALLAAGRDGIVDVIHVREGDVVEAGGELLQLHDEAARAQWQLAESRAANDVDIRFGRTSALAARDDYQAALELQQGSAISSQEVRRRRMEYERGMFTLEQAQAAQKLNALEAARARAELDAYCVTAPYSGMISRVLKTPGESVRNGEPVLELISTERVYVEGFGPLKELWSAQPGAAVRVQLDAPQLSELGVLQEIFVGRLVLVDTVVQPVSEQVRVVAEVINRGNILRDGLKARLVIDPTSAAPQAASLRRPPVQFAGESLAPTAAPRRLTR